jgi:hypothetical protein
MKSERHDRYDTVVPASFREYDEVMLHRICRMSNIPSPQKRGCFVNGQKMSWLYRDIHLGDFKFSNRWRDMKRMRSRIVKENVNKYIELINDKCWQKIVRVCTANEDVDRVLRRLNKHIHKRK